MICVRVVSNNRPEEVVGDPCYLARVTSIAIDPSTGDMILRGVDMALDDFEGRASFGTMWQVYH